MIVDPEDEKKDELINLADYIAQIADNSPAERTEHSETIEDDDDGKDNNQDEPVDEESSEG